ncbi:hypothetical protein ACET3Z_024077 [Daucus carota]
MNFEDLCSSGLSLGLACTERPKDRKISRRSSLNLALSLELSSEGDDVARSGVLERQVSSISAVSSLSDSDFMKSKLVGGIQELGGGREVFDDHDQDEDGSGGRKKLKLDRFQSRILEDSFKDHTTLNLKQKQALARRLNLKPRQVEVWYQNRRARNKLKQTEMECEMLKNCYETLKDENRRLEKELLNLRASEGKGMMQVPPANLTICPFCERITGSAVSRFMTP